MKSLKVSILLALAACVFSCEDNNNSPAATNDQAQLFFKGPAAVSASGRVNGDTFGAFYLVDQPATGYQLTDVIPVNMDIVVGTSANGVMVTNVNIDLLQNGTFVHRVASNILVQNSVQYPWVPLNTNFTSAGTNFKFRISDVSNPAVAMVQQATFTLGCLALNEQPVNTYTIGQTITITKKCSGTSSERVHIDLVGSGGSGIERIATNVAGNINTFNWVASQARAGLSYRFKITNANNPGQSYTQSNLFTINSAPVCTTQNPDILTFPIGGESYSHGYEVILGVQWNASLITSANALIEFVDCYNNNTLFSKIVPNSGTAAISALSGEYRVRISSIGAASCVSDISAGCVNVFID